MASSAIHHARSVSLPSRPHPVAEQLDQQLCRLRSSQSASTSSVSHTLNGLIDLYSCVDEFLQLPQNKKLVNQQCAEEVLDGSLRLLDICSTSRDTLVQSRDRLQDIQSALRRRCSGELSIANEAIAYLNIRKTTKKAMKQCLKSLKVADQSSESNAVINMLKDVEAVTIDAFKSLMSYIGGESQKSKWSVVSKLINQKTAKDVASKSEFDAVDATLNSICEKKNKGIDMSQLENLRNQMVKLESEIQDLDEALECLFRHLVKSRATLLNILSN